MPLNGDQEAVKFIISNSKTIAINEVVLSLLTALETAEYQSRVEIENDLVKMGKMSVNELVNVLNSENMLVRSHSAMALIRIGVDSIEPLLSRYKEFPHYHWMLEFIISEITGSVELLDYDNYYDSLAS